MTRREWLQQMGLAAGVLYVGAIRSAEARGHMERRGTSVTRRAAGDVKGIRARSAREAVDHLLLGAADLDQGIAWFEARSGVKAVFGGVHPGRGTRNALASLGRRQYLEIIAPDPAQDVFNFQIDLRKLAEPKLVNWAVASKDVDAAAATAVKTKYAVFGPQEGARTRADGVTLTWRTVGVLAPFRDAEVDPMPFFIQWGRGVKHPSEDSPAGCRLVGLELHHPDAAALHATLEKFDIDAPVTQAGRPGLTATLDTPRGRMTV